LGKITNFYFSFNLNFRNSTPSREALDKARELCNDLIKTVKAEHAKFLANSNKPQQQQQQQPPSHVFF